MVVFAQVDTDCLRAGNGGSGGDSGEKRETSIGISGGGTVIERGSLLENLG